MPKETVVAHLSRHDREIAAIRKLVLTGMKMLVRAEEERVAFRQDMRELAAAQKVTEKKLQGFIDAMARGTNGHQKKS